MKSGSINSLNQIKFSQNSLFGLVFNSQLISCHLQREGKQKTKKVGEQQMNKLWNLQTKILVKKNYKLNEREKKEKKDR